LLIKYIKSVLWRVAKRLSYIQDARCLKVKWLCNPHSLSSAAKLSHQFNLFLILDNRWGHQRKRLSTVPTTFPLSQTAGHSSAVFSHCRTSTSISTLIYPSLEDSLTSRDSKRSLQTERLHDYTYWIQAFLRGWIHIPTILAPAERDLCTQLCVFTV